MAIYVERGPEVAGAVITMVGASPSTSTQIRSLTLDHCIFAYITFFLRVYTRLRYAVWGPEDWAMACALPPFTVLSIACIACAFTGIGVKNATFAIPGNEHYQELSLFWFFFFEVFYCVNIIPVKVSIGLMLVRIAKNQKIYVYIQYGVMAIFITMNIIACGFIIFHCLPVEAAWKTYMVTQGSARCNPQDWLVDVYYATTAVNIFTDWVTAFMPIPLLWNVQLNRNAKISVAGVLGLGFFASLSACVRLKYTINLTQMENYNWALADIVIWGYAENGLGLIVGCLSTLRPLFRRLLDLGGDSSSKTFGPTSNKSAPLGSSNYGFPSNSRRTYQDVESHSHNHTTNYEMKTNVSVGVAGIPTRKATHDKYGNKEQSLGRESESDDYNFDAESQKRIIIQNHKKVASRDASGGDESGSGGILVTKQIGISHGN